MLCRRRFQLEQIWQLIPSAGRNSIHTSHGQAGHEALRAYDEARAANSGDPLRAALDVALIHTKDWPADTGEKAKTRATLFRSIIWYDEQFKSSNPLSPLVIEGNGPAYELGFKFPLFAERPAGPQLCGNLDGIVEFGGEIWILERKFTGQALSGFFWQRFDPNVQVDVYCLAAHLLWPQWNVQGVLVEAHQTGVTFARCERKMFKRSPGRLEETLRAIQKEVLDFEDDLERNNEPFSPRFASCMSDGGCPFRSYCQSDPSMREWELANHWNQRTDPWDPLHNQQEGSDAS